MNKPKITVLMAVHNGERYIRDAVDSMLSQTFRDFEFLIIDDGSGDKTSDIINSYKDDRIRFVHNKENIGMGESLNKGIRLALGDYIARMDCDDISIPNRLDEQFTFMENNPEVVLCGSWVKTLGKVSHVWKFPIENDEIKCRLLFDSVFVHSSVIMRKNILLEEGYFYNKEFIGAEDYELWVRMSKKYNLANIGKVLLKYRIYPEHSWARLKHEQSNASQRIRKDQLLSLYVPLSYENMRLHSRISNLKTGEFVNFFNDSREWLLLIEQINKKEKIYNEEALRRVLAYRFWALCNFPGRLGFRAWKIFWRSPFSKYVRWSLKEKVYFLIKCGLCYENRAG